MHDILNFRQEAMDDGTILISAYIGISKQTTITPNNCEQVTHELIREAEAELKRQLAVELGKYLIRGIEHETTGN